MEEWKECFKGVNKTYYVSNQGRVKSVCISRERILICVECRDGYKKFNFNNKCYKVHILVALHFIGSRPDGKVIDHINRIKTDNRVENLRYVSQSENARNTDFFRIDILEQDQRIRNLIINRESSSKKYTCICGTILRKDSKSKHERRKIHQAYLDSLE